MPGKRRTAPVPIHEEIVDCDRKPTEAFTRYLLDVLELTFNLDMPDMPTGIILMWSGVFADIPKGWHLCDGTDGTPDLHDRFLMGTTDEATMGGIGGYAEPQMPAHTHSIDHNHGSFDSSNNNSDHDHDGTEITTWYQTNASAGSGWTIPDSGSPTTTGNNNSDHDHTIDVPNYDGTSGSTEDGDQTWGNFPPFYKVAFIIRLEDPTRRRRR